MAFACSALLLLLALLCFPQYHRAMADYHAVYKGPAGETTQWGDIQRRLGNLPPLPPVWKPDQYTPEQEKAKDSSWLDEKDADELEDAEDEFADDRFLEEYRRKRMQELQHAVRRQRFGTVEFIRGAEFVQKVTDASRGARASSTAGAAASSAPETSGAQANAKPEHSSQPADTAEQGGIWVVCQLYKEGHGPSALIGQCLDELAEHYPHTKFVRIISTDCIPKYPDTNLPTLLVYHNGNCVKHIVGMSALGGQRTTPEQVALILNQLGPVCSNSTGDGQGEDAGNDEDVRLVKKLVQRIVVDRAAKRNESDED